MRHESSLIKSLCCKAWRRSMTGVFFCVPGFVEADWAGASIGLRDHCPLPFVQGFGFLANWLAWAQKCSMPHSGILKSASRSELPPLSLTQEKGRQFILDAGGALLPKGPGVNAQRMSGASTARCSWKNRRYRRSWQCLPSGRRTSGADRPSLRRFHQVPSCAHSLLCELRRLRCRSNRLRP